MSLVGGWQALVCVTITGCGFKCVALSTVSLDVEQFGRLVAFSSGNIHWTHIGGVRECINSMYLCS